MKQIVVACGSGVATSTVAQDSRNLQELTDVSISSTASTASTQANKFEPCKGWVLVATLNSAFLFSSFFILKGQHEVFRNWRSGGN